MSQQLSVQEHCSGCLCSSPSSSRHADTPRHLVDQGVNQSPYHGGMNAPHDPHLSGHSYQTQPRWSHTQYRPHHAQNQVEPHRTVQESVQGTYNLYDYSIGMLEELEKHETHGIQIPNSGILSHVIPVNQKRPKHEVITGINIELNCLRIVMRELPQEVITAVKKKLLIHTMKWAASRQVQGIPLGQVDQYCKDILEIILFHEPKELPSVDRAPTDIKPEQMNEAVYRMAVQWHHGEQQDAEFHRDPTKEATLRNKRQTEDWAEGAHRLVKDDPRLKCVLEEQGYATDMPMDIG